jgi:DNA repair protein RadA/Sms
VARPESRYVCQACGASTLRWEGQCRDCGAWNTLVETLARPDTGLATRRRRTVGGGLEAPVRQALNAIGSSAARRMPVGIGEVDRVLGGGFVPGALVLLGGEPGIGKSTLVMETAAGVAANGIEGGLSSVLYASGEESAPQLHLRAERLGLNSSPAGERIDVLATGEVDAILAAVLQRAPDVLIVDSVQTLTVEGLEGPAGSLGQVRESTLRLGAFAREEGVPVVLVGHVTKDGSLAGPKTLEHLVDVVMLLEGDRYGSLRLLRATKNRFGSTEEVGVLEMTGAGLREVLDPARAFLGESAREAPGVAVAATLEGSRPLLIEVQALVAPASGYGMPRRTVAGIDANRMALLVAVLGRRAGINLANQDLYASLAGGASVDEPAVDLPLALALASSYRDRPVRPWTVACGEVSLLGELRPVRGLERRLREAARLGFRRALVPLDRGGEAINVAGLDVVAVGTLSEALAAGLASAAGTSGEG